MITVALPDDMLDQCPLCPLDDRYRRETRELRAYFSAPALAKARLSVMVRYVMALSDEPAFTALPPLSEGTRRLLLARVDAFSAADYDELCCLEDGDAARQIAGCGHDVKACEYWLQQFLREEELEHLIPFLRFGVTSEDDTNLAYGLLIHGALEEVIRPHVGLLRMRLGELVRAWQNVIILGHTHGQPATPLSLGGRMACYELRLRPLQAHLESFRMHGKFGGAVGNLFAHYVACPDIDWQQFRVNFMQSLGLVPIWPTTQINPHQDLAELMHLLSRINTVLIDFCQNMWLYIHDGVLGLPAQPGEVGSSVMPHKVNPQDFETAEGSLIFSNACCRCLTEELPHSRLERHLSDSHLQRWLGVAFGCHVLGIKRVVKGLARLAANATDVAERLAAHPEVYGEAIQTVMRLHGYADGYEQLKGLTRGRYVTADVLADFVRQLERVPESAKARLLMLLSGKLDPAYFTH